MYSSMFLPHLTYNGKQCNLYEPPFSTKSLTPPPTDILTLLLLVSPLIVIILSPQVTGDEAPADSEVASCDQAHVVVAGEVDARFENLQERFDHFRLVHVFEFGEGVLIGRPGLRGRDVGLRTRLVMASGHIAPGQLAKEIGLPMAGKVSGLHQRFHLSS